MYPPFGSLFGKGLGLRVQVGIQLCLTPCEAQIGRGISKLKALEIHPDRRIKLLRIKGFKGLGVGGLGLTGLVVKL